MKTTARRKKQATEVISFDIKKHSLNDKLSFLNGQVPSGISNYYLNKNNFTTYSNGTAKDIPVRPHTLDPFSDAALSKNKVRKKAFEESFDNAFHGYAKGFVNGFSTDFNSQTGISEINKELILRAAKNPKNGQGFPETVINPAIQFEGKRVVFGKPKEVTYTEESFYEMGLKIGENYKAWLLILSSPKYFEKDFDKLEPKKEMLQLKDFFASTVDTKTVDTIQEIFKDYDGKKMAVLIFLLQTEFKKIKIVNSSKTKSRKAFVRLLTMNPQRKNTQSIDKCFVSSTDNINISEKNSDYINIKSQLSKLLTK